MWICSDPHFHCPGGSGLFIGTFGFLRNGSGPSIFWGVDSAAVVTGSPSRVAVLAAQLFSVLEFAPKAPFRYVLASLYEYLADGLKAPRGKSHGENRSALVKRV